MDDVDLFCSLKERGVIFHGKTHDKTRAFLRKGIEARKIGKYVDPFDGMIKVVDEKTFCKKQFVLMSADQVDDITPQSYYNNKIKLLLERIFTVTEWYLSVYPASKNSFRRLLHAHLDNDTWISIAPLKHDRVMKEIEECKKK